MTSISQISCSYSKLNLNSNVAVFAETGQYESTCLNDEIINSPYRDIPMSVSSKKKYNEEIAKKTDEQNTPVKPNISSFFYKCTE